MAKQKKLNRTIIAGGGNKLVRFSYANVFEPKAIAPGQPAKYSIMLLIDKDDKETIQAFTDAMNELIKAGLAQGMWDGELPDDFNKPLKDGDANPPKKGNPDDYKGKLYCNASSKYQPGIVDRQGRAIIDPEAFYSGCYGRAQLNLFPYDSMGNAGVGVGLNNLQKVKDGPSLSGRMSAEDAFKDFDNSKFEEDDDFEVGGVAADGQEMPF